MSSNTVIVVADTPEGVDAFCRALGGSFGVLAAARFDDARRVLHETTPAVVVCGCHFDEGRMYDLLRHVKAEPALARVPFVAVRCVEGELELDGALHESVKIAVRALGGDTFIDLLRWQRKYGEAAAAQRLTRLLQQLAADPAPDSR